MAQPHRQKLLVALEEAARRRLTRAEIFSDVFGCHLPRAEINTLVADLEAEGLVTVEELSAQGRAKRTTHVVILNMQDAKNVNGSAERVGPPPGDGWLPKQAMIRRAERGVMPASAERTGKTIRRKMAKKAKEQGTGVGAPRVSAESLGAAHLIRLVYLNYLRQGVIEVEGDWIRLAKNPPRRPPRSWHASFLMFLAEGHPTLDGKWHRKPKRTLVGVMEDALGRQLEEGERVRRWPGTAGSWNPNDIILYCEDRTILTLAAILAGRRP